MALLPPMPMLLLPLWLGGGRRLHCQLPD